MSETPAPELPRAIDTPGGLLPEIFADIVRRHPHRIALDVPPGWNRPVRQVLRYDELDGRRAVLATALRPLVRRDALVALYLSRENPDLYAGQLAVLSTGAAFLCLDPAAPPAYLHAILADARPVALLADPTLLDRLMVPGCPPLPPVIDAAKLDDASQPLPPVAITPSDLAYVIYTSGTTGVPKGVLIEHAGIANLVAQNVRHFGLRPGDRVAQCSSPAYDACVEETWLAFAVGATLVPLDSEVVRLGPDLVGWLRREQIHMLCPPPTLLRAMHCADPQRELPDLRLLYVGGEPLPADLAATWGVGRWLENGYGPTECTVTVVRGRVQLGEPVTIGLPVPGNCAWVLDGCLDEVPDGQEGELCIGGISLARGYLNRDDLTARQFHHHPRLGRLYRTGDLVRRLPDGRLVHLGRIDTQVKVSGHRLELEAVETLLAKCTGVRAAACRVQTEAGRQFLAAHVVPDDAQPPSLETIRRELAQQLPAPMLPARLAFLPRLPTSLSGKLDRHALPDIPGSEDVVASAVLLSDDPEQRAAAAFAASLGLPHAVACDAHFFLDLGGDSISAVETVCRLREAGHPDVTVRDVYEAPTATALAERLCRPRESARASRPVRQTLPAGARPLLCTALQAAWLALELFVAGSLAAVLTLLVLPALLRTLGLVGTTLLLAALQPLTGLLSLPIGLALTVLARRLLIGRYVVGRYPVWGSFYLRHWLVTHLAGWIPWRLIAGTVLTSAVLRALGARVGRRVCLHRSVPLQQGGWDLLTLGDGVTLAQDADIRLVSLEDGELVVGAVELGDGATLDIRAGVGPGTTVQANGYLTPLSWLPAGSVLPAGQCWDGVPGRPIGPALETPVPATPGLSPLAHAGLLLMGRLLLPLLGWLPVLAVVLAAQVITPNATEAVLHWLEEPDVSLLLASALLLGSSLWVVVALMMRGLLCRGLGRVRPGVYSAWSLEAIRIDLKIGAVNWANRWLSGSLFWPAWLRLAGMRVGRGCEISTIIEAVPEMIEIGEWCFFADGIYLCPPVRHRGAVVVAASRIGAGTFVGNHAVIPAGHDWPADLFVGVATVPNPAQATTGSAWFGHPPLRLPRREQVMVDRRLTHHPGPIRFTTRVFWEVLRLALPWLALLVLYAWYVGLEESASWNHPGWLLLAGPIAGLASAVALCLALVGLKWLLLGKVRPGQHPLWSCWCSRWDFVYVAWTMWAQAILARLEGTLLLNAFLRLVGVPIGRRVVLGPGFSMVVDPDLTHIEDDATVTGHFQAHTFEDRVLKRDTVRIGKGATIGGNAIVFMGAQVGAGARVDGHAVVMKYDRLDAGRDYEGCPTRPMEACGTDQPVVHLSDGL